MNRLNIINYLGLEEATIADAEFNDLVVNDFQELYDRHGNKCEYCLVGDLGLFLKGVEIDRNEYCLAYEPMED